MSPDVEPTPERKFDPSIATQAAWEAQAFMAAYASSTPDTARAEAELANARQSFGEVVEHTQGLLFAVLMNRTGKQLHAVQDIMQETYIRAFEKISKFRGDSQIEGWLISISFNELARYYQKESKHMKRRTQEVSFVDLMDDGGDDPLEEKGLVCEPDEAAELWHLHRDEITDGIDGALADLVPGQRKAVVLRYWLGMSHAEIAEHLGISENASKIRLTRARQKLAESSVLAHLLKKVL